MRGRADDWQLARRMTGRLCLAALLACSPALALAKAKPQQALAAPASAADADYLTRHNWRLVSAVSGPSVGPLLLPKDAASQPEMRFHPRASAQEGHLLISKLCNGAGIAYRLTSDRRILEVRNSNLTFTLMACEDDVSERERRMRMQLKHIHSFEPLKPTGKALPQLKLRFSDGANWLFEGSPTLDARYGPPISLTLQIAPELVPCAGPASTEPAQAELCMQVRRVRKSNALCPTPQEDWQVHRGQIQGFSYAPGYRYELDIKRYVDRSAPPGRRAIDVMVSESATLAGDVRKRFGERAKNMPPFSFDRCK